MRRAYKVFLSIVSIGLILVLTVPAVQKKEEKTEEVKIKELLSVLPIKEGKETKIIKNSHLMEGITGLIFEKTMTNIGYEFYENFFSLWKAPTGITGYNIYINEKASPMWGSLVYIKVNNTLVWRGMIRPRSGNIEKAVKNSISVVKNYLYRYEEIRKQLEKGGDMLGNGIY